MPFSSSSSVVQLRASVTKRMTPLDRAQAHYFTK